MENRMSGTRISWNPSKTYVKAINDNYSMSREFRAEIPFSYERSFVHQYTFGNRYAPIDYHGGHYFQVNYHYDIFSKDFSSEKMGFASLNFKSEESAQAFLEGMAESDLGVVLKSLDDSDKVTQENAKNVKALFKYVDKNTRMQHSLFQRKREDSLMQEKSSYISCVSK